MSFYDLLAMSLGNLWRRKLRTILTILGVLIGTASIVAMLSLALGMQKMIMDEYSSMGSITQINVSSMGESSSGGKLNLDGLLTDSNMELFQSMEHVESVSPILDFGVNLNQGKYNGYAELMGVDQSVIESQTLGEGQMPGEGGGSLQVLAGNTVLTNFGYMMGDEYIDYYSTGELPDIDLMKQVKQVQYYDEYSTGEDTQETSDGNEDTLGDDNTGESDETADDIADTINDMDDGSVTLRVKITGVLEGGPDDYNENSSNLLVDIDSLKNYLTKNFGKDNIPGQPKDNGKPLKEWVYNSLIVNVDQSDYVEDVMSYIQEMGFEASSNKELLESVQKNVKIIELVLGGIGMVAFLVAAIGIANTMMMSTYERTKEIGVMKVLGCDMRDIQKLFLAEAGFIGFIGGMVGLGFTCILSAVLNSLAQSAGGMNGNISLITWWLAVIAVVFSTMMGMLAGFFPARRAMKLSPLAAIRTE